MPEHQRHSERRLKLHLLPAGKRGLVESQESLRRPAMTLVHQRHGEENPRGSGSKLDADARVAVRAEGPFQPGPDIIEPDEMGHPFRPGRQGRPCASRLLQPAPVIVCMTRGQLCRLVVVRAVFEGIGARRVEKPVAHHRPHLPGGDHRFGDEPVDGIQHERRAKSCIRHDFHGRVEREKTDEHSQPAKHLALQVGEQPIAPVQRGLKGSLTRRSRPQSRPCQLEILVQERRRLLQPIGADTTRRQFDGQRHTVELPADIRDDQRFDIADVQLGATRDSALDEQLHRRKCLGGRCCQAIAVRRTRERVQSVDLLVLDPKRFPTGRQDMNLGGGDEYL